MYVCVCVCVCIYTYIYIYMFFPQKKNELLAFVSDTSCVFHEEESVVLYINDIHYSLRKGMDEGL
jgi:hypothetical protein